jgi:hypothetical protein
MDIRNSNSQPTLSSQRRYERLQVDADRLFDIGWLIERLMHELRQMLATEPAPSPSRLFSGFRRNAEQRFAWEMLHAHTKSLSKVSDLQQIFPERDQLISKLQEEREQQIDLFSQLMISKRWDTLRDDDSTWRRFAHMMYNLSATTPEMNERFFALVDYIYMLTLAILGKEKQYFQEADNDTTTVPLPPTSTAPNLDSIDVRAELKLFLREAWFDKFSTDRKRFTSEWRDRFVNALIESDYGEAIIVDFTNETRDKRQIVKGAIVGCLKAAGVFAESDLSMARAILYPQGSKQAVGHEEEAERKKKSKTLSSYIGREKKQKYYYWVLEWVEAHPSED